MTDEKKIDRRGLLGLLASGPLALWAAAARAQSLQPPHFPQAPRQFGGMFQPEVPERPSFFFTQLSYGEALAWNPYPTAARSLMEMLIERTSVPASPDRVDVHLTDPKLFQLPFLYWTGTRDFAPLAQAEIERLRLYLESGGFLLVDDALGTPGVGFDRAFQREFARLFPGKAMARLPQDHTVFISYYIIDRVTGRVDNRPYLSGYDIGERTAVIYSGNDLGGAWARDRSGSFINPTDPGGEMQREHAIRLGINLVLYALCINYKKDLIHTPFISERRRGKKP